MLNILITNDDGIHAKGLRTLIEIARPFGNITVVAPDQPMSGMGHAITVNRPLRLNLLKKEGHYQEYACSGTPVDCVKMGQKVVLQNQNIDLLLSGINHGSNAAICVIYSGTMGAAMEGCILGVPSLGVSLTDRSSRADFSQAVWYGRNVAEKILAQGLPKGICLNLNVPKTTDVKGLKVCTQTMGYWTKEFKRTKDASGYPIYWLTGEFANEEPDNEQNDEWALSKGYAALVPIQIDMTAHHYLEQMKNAYEI